MTEISVIICCANSEDTLAVACRSARWADEIIVVDSGSTDRTPDIAREFADRYVHEPWRGYAGQKIFAQELATHDWILFLDGDEECTPRLAQEIADLSVDAMDAHDLYLVPRRNWMFGRPVRAWWPDRLTRLYHRRRCTWNDHALHDTRHASHPSRVGSLRGWLEHKRLSNAGWSDYFSGARLDERLMPVARQMHQRGKHVGMMDLIFRPWAAFFKSFVLKRGFLDGGFGLLIAQKSAVSTQLKYAALWTVQQEAAMRQAAANGLGTQLMAVPTEPDRMEIDAVTTQAAA